MGLQGPCRRVSRCSICLGEWTRGSSNDTGMRLRSHPAGTVPALLTPRDRFSRSAHCRTKRRYSKPIIQSLLCPRNMVEGSLVKSRTWLVAIAVLLIGVGTSWYVRYLRPIQRWWSFCDVTRSDLETLSSQRPPDLSVEYWSFVVDWTLNAHSNCLTHQDITQQNRDQFSQQLKQQLARPVDLRTIDWIWDEIARISPHGQRYSDNYRPTAPEHLREFNVKSH